MKIIAQYIEQLRHSLNNSTHLVDVDVLQVSLTSIEGNISLIECFVNWVVY